MTELVAMTLLYLTLGLLVVIFTFMSLDVGSQLIEKISNTSKVTIIYIIVSILIVYGIGRLAFEFSRPYL